MRGGRLCENALRMHWLDAAWLRFTRRARLFGQGWGDVEGPTSHVGPLLGRTAAQPLALEFLPTSPRTDEAFAPSPAPLLDGHTGRLHVVRLRAKGPNRARLIVPPSWGDEGFGARTHLFDALRYQGVELWFLEGAYFGSRRAAGQQGMNLPTVGDFLRMGLANVVEVRALIATALELKPSLPVALAGYSMAGQMSAHAAASLDVEVPVTVMAPPDEASVVFCDGPLSQSVDVSALGGDAVERLRLVLRRLSVLAQPVPPSPRRAVVITTSDGIVAPAAMERLARHWDVTPARIDSGHLGAYAFHGRALRRAVLANLP